MNRVNKNAEPKLSLVDFRPRDRRPLYQQLAEGIATQIRDGALPRGSKLPPLREIARVHRVALVTASQAYEMLSSEGLVESRSGRGTFVTYDLEAVEQARPPQQAQVDQGRPLQINVGQGQVDQGRPLQAGLGRASALRVLRSAVRPGSIVLSTGSTAPETYPIADFAQCYAQTFLDDPPEIHQYRADRGDAELRELFAQRLRARGADIGRDDILIVSGAQQALSLVADALIDSGDAAVAEAPTYFSALEVFDQKRVSWTNASVDADGVIPASLRDAVWRSSARIIYLNTAAHNPTGSFLSRARHRPVLDIARRAQLTLIEDQSFWPVCFDGEAPPPLIASDRDGRVVCIESMSKLYMPSLRIGYIAAKGELQQRLYASKLRADAFTTTVSQRALLRFLRSRAAARHLRATRVLYRRRRDALLAHLRPALPNGARALAPRGGVNVWVELPPDWSAPALLNYSAQEGVLFLTGEPFYPTQAPQNTLRMSYGNLPESVAEEAMARFGRAVRAYAASRKRAKRGAAEEAAITAAV